MGCCRTAYQWPSSKDLDDEITAWTLPTSYSSDHDNAALLLLLLLDILRTYAMTMRAYIAICKSFVYFGELGGRVCRHKNVSVTVSPQRTLDVLQASNCTETATERASLLLREIYAISIKSAVAADRTRQRERESERERERSATATKSPRQRTSPEEKRSQRFIETGSFIAVFEIGRVVLVNV